MCGEAGIDFFIIIQSGILFIAPERVVERKSYFTWQLLKYAEPFLQLYVKGGYCTIVSECNEYRL
jgi:hypothetical protein